MATVRTTFDVRSTLDLLIHSSAAALLGLALTTGCNNGGGGDGDATATDTNAGTADDDGDGDGSGTADETGTDGGELEGIEPLPGGMRRMLSHEYTRSIELLLGAQAAAAATPPNDTGQDGWDAVGSNVLSLDGKAVEDYEASATFVAAAAVTDLSTLAQTVPCVTSGPMDATCYEAVATDFGRLAFRRSLSSVEVDQLVAIADAARTWGEGDFVTGLRYELIAILQAPSFLYIHTVGEPHESGYRALTQLELATRMSFFLLGRTPDVGLLDAAEAGQLETEEQIRAQAEAMMGSENARVALFTFFDELFRLRFLAQTIKDEELFPAFTPALAEAMRQETLLLVYDIVWQKDGDYRDLFTADYTFLTDDLATHYGLPIPGTGNNPQKTPWPANQNRAGFLSQGSFLSVHAHHAMNSPSKRGKYVNLALLCNTIPPPPPDVEVELPVPQPGQTLREALLAHKDIASCASCHDPMDEVGFAFEFFDAVGAYRTLDNGSPIVASGTLASLGSWNNAAELGQVLKDDPRTSRCLVNNLVRGELGQLETPGVETALVDLDASFAENGYSMKSLMVEMVANPMFRFVDEPK